MTEADCLLPPTSTTSPRLACMFCKKRKLRCNKELPQCDSCVKYGFECEYGPPKEGVKRDPKSAPYLSHTKRFEDRLERVESLILQATNNGKRRLINQDMVDLAPGDGVIDIEAGYNFAMEDITELEELFFVFVSPSVNIIHESTHMRQCKLDAASRPPDFLRHAMCCLAAYASKRLSHLKDSFYQSARRLLQEAEIKDQDFDKVTIAHAQTWIMIAVYELKESVLHRSLMSISRAVRLVQLLRLYCVDRMERLQSPAPNLISVPTDWLQAEERRRLFWFTFLMDRYTAISMGWPVLLDTRDIRTLLPVSDESYQNSMFESSMFLSEATKWEKHHLLSNFAAQIVGIDLCHNRVQGLNRLEMSSDPSDLMGDSWALFMQIESLLKGIFPIPQQLIIPPAKLTPSNVLLNMAQASTIIMTHRIARFHLQLSPLSQDMLKIGVEKCKEAAGVILRLMKMTSHWNIHMHHFCTSFCVYTAALVYGTAWNSDPNDLPSRDSLRFLVDCLHKFKRTTRLPIHLFSDLERELPGLLGRLKDETPELDMYERYIDVNDDQSTASIDASLQQFLEIVPASTIEATDSENLTPPDASFDTTAWIVDDPDIASVARYL